MNRAVTVTVLAFLLGNHTNAILQDIEGPPSILETVDAAGNAQSRRRLKGSGFKTLQCNKDMKPCVSWTSLFGKGMIKRKRVVIPCGTCVFMDLPGQRLTLVDGMDIRGRLEIRGDSQIHIVAPMIVVQGYLLVMSIWRVQGQPRVRFTLQGRGDQFFTPVGANRNLCEGGECNVGPRSFTVAGGKVNFRGLYAPVPTVVNLYAMNTDKAIVLPDESGLLSHWKEGAELVITTTSHLYDYHQVRTITKSGPWRQKGYVRLQLNETIFHETTTVEDSNFAAEVALLSRNIVIESPQGSGGGHFWVMNTPYVNQEIRGVDFRNMGQAGKLGRYPIHFHMCGDLSGSVIVKNTIRQSNQRGIVVHGTNNLLLEENVAFDVKGHSYVLEDGIETGNRFIKNIAIYTRNQDVLIPPDPIKLNGNETDGEASGFWITNANNVFIGNTVAGSQSSGFWFELMKRGPRAADYPDLNPLETPIGRFEANSVHSVPATAVRFYLNGYEPKSLQTIKGLKIYRCYYGLKIHRVHSVRFVDSVFADNSYSVFIDLSANIRFTRAKIIGWSETYKNYVRRNRFGRAPCPRVKGEQLQGIRFARDNPWEGSPLNGLYLTNVKFLDFGGMPCGKAAFKLHPVPTNYKTFDMGSILKRVPVDTNLVDFCPGGARGFTDVYLSDATGSIAGNGRPSTIMVNSPEMTKFVNKTRCFNKRSRCNTWCKNTCFRSVFYGIPAEDSKKWKLKVCDRGNRSFCQIYDVHTKSHASRSRYAVHLPSGRKYDAVFVSRSTGREVYPTDVEVVFQDKMCPTAPEEDDIRFRDLPPGVTNSPTMSPTTIAYRCDQTVRNSDMESGTGHWKVKGLGGMTTTLGFPQRGKAIKYLGANRGTDDSARIETTLNVGTCFQYGTTWEFKARLKLTNSTTGEPVSCDSRKGDIVCPKILLTLRDFDSTLFHYRIMGFHSHFHWKPRRFNLFRGYWTVGTGVNVREEGKKYWRKPWTGMARIVRAGFVGVPVGIDLAIDNFEVDEV